MSRRYDFTLSARCLRAEVRGYGSAVLEVVCKVLVGYALAGAKVGPMHSKVSIHVELVRRHIYSL